jgi:hypothetical protein
MSTAKQSGGDPISQRLHSLMQKKVIKPKAPTPSTAPAEEVEEVDITELEELVEKLNAQIRDFEEEIEVLRRQQLAEEDAALLEQMREFFKTVQPSADINVEKELRELHAGFEDLRTQFDEMHAREVLKGVKASGDWEIGHLLLGGATAGGYAAVAQGVNLAAGKVVVPVGLGGIAAAFMAGVVIWETVKEL